jgi:hypothetical protein
MNPVQISRLVGERVYSVKEVARLLGYESAQGFYSARKAGRYGDPDFRFSKVRAYYKASTVRRFMDEATQGNAHGNLSDSIAKGIFGNTINKEPV